VNPFAEGVAWLNDPLNWTNPGGILDRLGEHLVISAWAVLIACLVAWPVGLWLGHRGRGGGVVVTVSNLTLAVPTIALLTILPQMLTVFHDYEHIALGAIMIVFMIFLRAGIVPSLASLFRRSPS